MRIWGDVEGGGLVKRREGSGGGRTGVLWLVDWIGGTYATRTTTTTEKNFIDVRTKKTGGYQRDVRQVNQIGRTRSYSRLGGTYGITTGQRIGISDDVK